MNTKVKYTFNIKNDKIIDDKYIDDIKDILNKFNFNVSFISISFVEKEFKITLNNMLDDNETQFIDIIKEYL
jgi:hypothetical protein